MEEHVDFTSGDYFFDECFAGNEFFDELEAIIAFFTTDVEIAALEAEVLVRIEVVEDRDGISLLEKPSSEV